MALAGSIGVARADVVFQPDGQQVPSEPGCRDNMPTGLLPVFACVCDVPGVCNIGAVCASETSCDDGMNATCESRMWHVFNDNTCIPSQHDGIDPRADASLVPETFAPTCALTFTVESRGTADFQNAFGWYNVTGTTPGPDDLHVMLPCDAAEGTTVVLDVRSEPEYLGGAIGFFLITPENHAAPGTCAGGNCCASVERLRAGAGYAYFSERAHNPDLSGAQSYVHLLVYDSVISERKFYFAWEDTFNSSNDDFTDLVTSVSGVECGGAGQECDTGLMGACGVGITRCTDGVLGCVPRYTGEAERCDGLDNDCDGEVDETVVCPDGQVCDDGECVPNCEIAVEFMCLGVRWECDGESGFCVEPSCRDVTCPAGEVCRDGDCRGECDGIVCPLGQTCFLDHCIDACAAVTCAAGEVCRGGLCLPGCNQCDGLACGAEEICDASTGDCRHRDCPATCPAGTVCVGPGGCRDACDGAVCPRGEVCTDGHCRAVEIPEVDAGPDWRLDGGRRDGGLIDPPDASIGPGTSSGCGCRATKSSSRLPWALVAIAIVLVVRRRR